MKTSLLILASLTIAATAAGRVRPASTITDNMVLQQNTDARLYGFAKPDAKVTATPSWNHKTYTAKADKNGKWILTVETPAGGYTPYEITLSDGEPLTLSNVLVGEVWLASGQSNMEMPLRGFWECPVKGAYDEIAGSSQWRDRIRFMSLPLVQSYTPMDTVSDSWIVPHGQLADRLNKIDIHNF